MKILVVVACSVPSLVATAGICAAALAAPVHAEPVDEPCPLTVSLVCRLVPIVPSLDGDVDYTQHQSGAGIVAPESALPVDPCASSCI